MRKDIQTNHVHYQGTRDFSTSALRTHYPKQVNAAHSSLPTLAMTVLTLTHHLNSHSNKQKWRSKGAKLAVRLAGMGVGITISSILLPVRLRPTRPSAARNVRFWWRSSPQARGNGGGYAGVRRRWKEGSESMAVEITQFAAMLEL